MDPKLLEGGWQIILIHLENTHSLSSDTLILPLYSGNPLICGVHIHSGSARDMDGLDCTRGLKGMSLDVRSYM